MEGWQERSARLPQTAEDLKAEAKHILGEQTYEAATKMTVLELSRAFASAHQQFDDRTARAYKTCSSFA